MYLVALPFLFILALILGAQTWIHFGDFIVAHGQVIVVGIGAILFLANYLLSPAPVRPSPPSVDTPEDTPERILIFDEGTDADGDWKAPPEQARGLVVWEISDETEASPDQDPEMVKFLRKRLEAEIRAKWLAQQLALLGPADARIAGRVARIDRKSEEALFGSIWMAVADDQDGHQAIKLQGAFADLGVVTEGDRLTLRAGWSRGRLTWMEVEAQEACEDPLPEVKLPEPKDKETASQDGKLPTMAELDKAAREGGWGALNHSVYRFPVPVHITMAPKGRAKLFEGKAIEVQGIMREVAESEGLRVIACASEGDHIHLLGMPAGKGGMPPTWQWSRWVGRWKALTSRRLKSLPGLEDFQWQTGYAINSVTGGKQGAEEALTIVRRYVEAQGDQGNDNYPKGGDREN